MGRQLGERVVLREYRAEDISALRAWVNDGETTRYLGGAYRRPQTWEQTEDWLNRRLNGDLGGESFVIAEKDSQKYLGQCDLMMIDSVARKAEIAIVLLPEARGKGIAAEALKLLLRYAFDVLNLNRVFLKCAAKNEAALRLYRRNGFREEGILRQDLYIDGEYEDAVLMGLLKNEIKR